MRLVELASLALIVWALHRLAREHRLGGSRALWLGGLNPLLLIDVVGGMHNDGLMIGLMLAGFVLALRGKWIAGSALVGLAMMVESPAAVSLLFIGVLVHAAATGPQWRRWVKGSLAPGLTACAVAGGATLIAVPDSAGSPPTAAPPASIPVLSGTSASASAGKSRPTCCWTSTGSRSSPQSRRSARPSRTV
ncbi:hypothetical protein SBADM41S_06974 [Streptomyces badius]